MSRGRPKDGGGGLKTCGLGPARLRLRLNRAGRPAQGNAETSQKPLGGGNLDSRCRAFASCLNAPKPCDRKPTGD